MEIEIMSPVGSYESLAAAIQAGAGSVYFGVGKMNMRSRSAANFGFDDLRNITDICRQHNVKSYLTVNTIVYNHELEEVKRLLEELLKAKAAPTDVEVNDEEDATEEDNEFEGEIVWNPAPEWEPVAYAAGGAALVGLGALLYHLLKN